MTDDLRPTILAAMKQAGGDRAEAQRLVLHQAVNSLPLLLALTKNHLKAIVGAAIDFYAREGEAGARASAAKPAVDTADLQLLNPASSGLASPAIKVTKVADLQPLDADRQASTWAKIAGAFKKKN
jgi:hypothetical protein